MFRWLLRYTNAPRRFQPTPSLIPLISVLAIVLAATTGAILLNGSPASAGSGDARPRVTNVTSPLADGVYGVGARIPITVHFDQAVAVDVPDSGIGPRLRLETGRSDARARFLRLSSYSNILTFLYSVRLGDRSPDLDVAVERILLNGARIHNRDGVDADVTLPRPGRPGSLSANKNLVIRTLRGPTDAVGAPPPATNVAPPMNDVAERAFLEHAKQSLCHGSTGPGHRRETSGNQRARGIWVAVVVAG